MDNIIRAAFGAAGRTAVAPRRYRYDYGQILRIEGVSLPDAYEVHFANSETSGTTITQIGGADGVTVPDQLFLTGKPVYAWFFLHTGADDGRTIYRIQIPVQERPAPSDEEPTPVQQSAIDQAIAALNVAVAQTAEDVEAAKGYAESAEQSASAASTSAQAASASEANALSYAQRAETAEGNASASALAAAASERSANASEESAEVSADRAEQAAASAGFLDVEIVDGRLIYIRTDQVDVDFSLEDGHLIMEAV